MSGAPYIIELIERSLLHDLKVFSIAAFVSLGLSALAIIDARLSWYWGPSLLARTRVRSHWS